MCVCSSLSHVQLWNPMDCSPLGSSVHRILQARTLEWVASSFSTAFALLRDQTQVSHPRKKIIENYFRDF